MAEECITPIVSGWYWLKANGVWEMDALETFLAYPMDKRVDEYRWHTQRWGTELDICIISDTEYLSTMLYHGDKVEWVNHWKYMPVRGRQISGA